MSLNPEDKCKPLLRATEIYWQISDISSCGHLNSSEASQLCRRYTRYTNVYYMISVVILLKKIIRQFCISSFREKKECKIIMAKFFS